MIIIIFVCLLFWTLQTRPNQIKSNFMTSFLALLVITGNIIHSPERLFCLVNTQQQSFITISYYKSTNMLITYYVQLVLNQIEDLESSLQSRFKFPIFKMKQFFILLSASACMLLVHFWSLESRT